MEDKSKPDIQSKIPVSLTGTASVPAWVTVTAIGPRAFSKWGRQQRCLRFTCECPSASYGEHFFLPRGFSKLTVLLLPLLFTTSTRFLLVCLFKKLIVADKKFRIQLKIPKKELKLLTFMKSRQRQLWYNLFLDTPVTSTLILLSRFVQNFTHLGKNCLSLELMSYRNIYEK